MHFAITARVLGVLLMIFSLTMLTPIIVASIYGENTAQTFLIAFAITLLMGLVFWLPSRNRTGELRTRDGFIVTVLFWLVLSTFGALPLMLSEALQAELYGCSFRVCFRADHHWCHRNFRARRSAQIYSLLSPTTTVARRHWYCCNCSCHPANARGWWHADLPR